MAVWTSLSKLPNTNIQGVKNTAFNTINTYVDIISIKIIEYSNIVIIPWVTDTDLADFKVLAYYDDISNISDPALLTWVDHTERTSLAQNTSQANGKVLVLPLLEGIKAIKIQAKSTVTDTPSVVDTIIHAT